MNFDRFMDINEAIAEDNEKELRAVLEMILTLAKNCEDLPEFTGKIEHLLENI